MSTNLVLCVSDEDYTVRLTKYRCKPVMFLNLLGSLLAELPSLVLTDVEEVLVNNGFEVEQTYDQEFSSFMMQSSLMVNWAWLLDVKNKELKYWDVTAALDGLDKMISGPSIDPLDCLQWMSISEQEEMSGAVTEGIHAVQKAGVTVVNYQSS